MAPRVDTRTLVLQNVHSLACNTTVLQMLKYLANVEQDDVSSIVFWPVANGGICQINAFVNFKTVDRAVKVRDAIGYRSYKVPCPPLPPGDFGQVIEKDGSLAMPNCACNRQHFISTYVAMWGGFIGRANPKKLKGKEWVCSMCGLPNYRKYKFCYRCDAIDSKCIRKFFQPLRRDMVKPTEQKGTAPVQASKAPEDSGTVADDLSKDVQQAIAAELGRRRRKATSQEKPMRHQGVTKGRPIGKSQDIES